MNIVVLAGGLSTERDVSFSTGNMVAQALRGNGHRVILLDVFMGYRDEETELGDVFADTEAYSITFSGIPETAPDLAKVKRSRKDQSDCFFGPNVIQICRKADIVFLGLHGENGENGKVQAAFDLFGIRYTGSDYLSSAIAMNKEIAKRFMDHAGVPVPKGVSMTKRTREDDPDALGITLPCVVKPCCGGSSIGVTIVRDPKEFAAALDEGFRWEDELVIEEYIKGREFSVGVIEDKALPIIEIAPIEGFYDYKNKYKAGSAIETCPAELTQEQTARMQRYARMAARSLGLTTYSRIDFLLDEKDEMYCLEANTLPGMTPTSLLPQEAAAVGIDFSQLCEKLIAISLDHYEGGKRHNEMPGLTVEVAANVCGGTYYGPKEVLSKVLTGIVRDNRDVEPGNLFVAIPGEKVDGHRFIPDALSRGAYAALAQQKQEDPNLPYILVPSTTDAMKKIAAYYRRSLGIPVVGITGSVGKTSTKEMIASVLARKYKVWKTEKNFNNEIGLPLTIFGIKREHEVAVLEMGISDFGEMHRLGEIANPDICVITNIGQCHLENLGTREGVLNAQTEMFEHLRPNGTVILNGDDDLLCTKKTVNGRPALFFGVGESEDKKIFATDIENHGFEGMKALIHTPQGTFVSNVPAPGEHSVYNAMAATAVGLTMGMTLEEIEEGIEAVKAIEGRMNQIDADGVLVIDDCYNANPVSMKAALEILSHADGRSVAVLGDMGELGEDERRLHYEIGVFAGKQNISALFAAGPLAEEYVKGIRTTQADCEVRYFADRDSMTEELLKFVRPGDSVLIKASHFMEFSKVVESLTTRA